MVAKNRQNGKTVHIDYSFDFNIPGPTTIYNRKKIIHRRNIEKAKIILKERNAEKGWWDLIAEITETLVSSDKVINEYTDRFSVTI